MSRCTSWINKHTGRRYAVGVCEVLYWTCPVCQKLFIPRPGHRASRPQKTCARRFCVNEHRRKHFIGKIPVEARETRRDAYNDKFKAELRKEFGPLTDREQRLVKRVYVTAHNRGYQKGIHAQRRTSTAVAA